MPTPRGSVGNPAWRIMFIHLLPNACRRSSCRRRWRWAMRSSPWRRCPSSASASSRRRASGASMTAEGAQLHRHRRMVAVPVPRPRHRADGAVLQPDRRRAARLPRSAHAGRAMSAASRGPRTSRVRFATDHGEVEAVDGGELRRARGRDPGPGRRSRARARSVTATAILRLIRKPGRPAPAAASCSAAAISRRWPRRSCSKIRGAEIAMISQTPRTALNPLITVGRAGRAAVRRCMPDSRRPKRARARDRDADAGRHPRAGAARPAIRPSVLRRHVPAGDDRHGARHLAAPADRRRADDRPRRLDAARILDLLRELGRGTGASILLITHDLGVVATTCRPGRGHACRPDRRGGAGARAVRAIPPIPIRARWCARSRASTARSSWSRSPARCRRCSTAAGLPLRRPLPVGRGALPAHRSPAMTEVAPDHFVACFAVEDGRAAALCEVDDLKMHFPLRGSAAWLRTLQDGKPPVVRAVDGVSFGVEARRDAGAGGRIGLRQIHGRPRAGAAGAADARAHPLRRRGAHDASATQAFNKVRPRPADGVPGSDRLAQPAPVACGAWSRSR